MLKKYSDFILISGICYLIQTSKSYFGNILGMNLFILLPLLCANAADDKLMIVFLFFQKNRNWHFMQIVSIRDSLHELWILVSWVKYEKCLKVSSAGNFTQSAKRKNMHNKNLSGISPVGPTALAPEPQRTIDSLIREKKSVYTLIFTQSLTLSSVKHSNTLNVNSHLRGNELYKQNAFVQTPFSLLFESCYTVCIINVRVIEKEINV